MATWVLRLNPMRDRAETVRLVAQAGSKEALEAFIERERVEPYRDERWLKVFKQDGPLEWFNPPNLVLDGEPMAEVPERQAFVDRAVENARQSAVAYYDHVIAPLPVVG